MENRPDIETQTLQMKQKGHKSSLWKEVGRRFIKKKIAMFGFVFLLFIFLFSFVGPFFFAVYNSRNKYTDDSPTTEYVSLARYGSFR